jgi:hypothetical protein
MVFNTGFHFKKLRETVGISLIRNINKDSWGNVLPITTLFSHLRHKMYGSWLVNSNIGAGLLTLLISCGENY